MKPILLLILCLLLISCGKEKVILLPEIDHSEITEINDVSVAYLFYDETQPDSVELNRKNLISTTNWLVNADKRLTLKQVIPYIQFLQDKKANSSHKNKNVKNYFTCNDISRKNLGFIEFTNVIYEIANTEKLNKKKSSDSILFTQTIDINFDSMQAISVIQADDYDATIATMNWEEFSKSFEAFEFPATKDSINISYNENLLFQNYITFKSFLNQLKKEGFLISNNEIITD